MTNPLDLLDVPQDDTRPMTDRDRQLAQLRAAAPLRPRCAQHSSDVIGLPLFEPTLF